MRLGPDYKAEYESLKILLLDMAQQRSVDVLLEMIVRRLAQRPQLALVRIWLVLPGNDCVSCPLSRQCPQLGVCLHLVASAGSPMDFGQGDESGPGGDFQCLPLGVGNVGRIAASGKPLEILNIANQYDPFTPREWLQREGIVGFVGQPLSHRGNILGVLALYVRIQPEQEGIVWARMIADHAASAIANARAFEEIERLRRQLELENEYLREEVLEARALGDIIGKSPAILNVVQQIDLVAPTDASVLILGESGTGKELVAREIYKRSGRQSRAMIKINCASIPKELYESEFFGHVKGAFTGAIKDRAGRFEAADGGTLFLDEVGEIPLELQGKLLRVLQDGHYERVGEEVTRQVDVRIIAATNRNLKQEVEERQFRQDLYYRLNVFPIEIAPLRRRREDIPLLAGQFLKQVSTKMNRPLPRLTEAHLLDLQSYDWPGNVRELQNVIERAVITSRSGTLHFNLPRGRVRASQSGQFDRATRLETNLEVLHEEEMRRRERDNIRAALFKSNGKIYGPGGAAELIGLRPTTLAARIKKMGLRKSDLLGGDSTARKVISLEAGNKF